MRKKNNKLGSFRKNWLSSIVSDIEHCQLGGPVGNCPPFCFPPTTHKIEQRKKTEKRDGPLTDHSTISAKPYFNKLHLPAPFLKEFDSFYKDIANFGNVTA
jgi:hypothetical protein